MFKIKSNPTFEATLTLIGQGVEQKLQLTYRHKTSDEYDVLMNRWRDGELDTAGVLMEIVEKWDADEAFGRDAIELLQQHQPGANVAIIAAYNEAMLVARQKN